MPVDLVRQAAFRPTSNPTIGIIIELSNGSQVAVLQSQLDNLTAAEVQIALRTATGLDNIFIHRNRDDTVAIAVGNEPETWPEDASWQL